MGLHRVLHLHGLQNHHDFALGNLLAFLHIHLNHGALHRSGHGITRNTRLRTTGTTLLCLLLSATSTAASQRQITWQRNLNPPAINLHHNLLVRGSLFRFLRIRRINIGRNRVLPFLLNPLGIHIKVRIITNKGRILHNMPVEWHHSWHAFDHIFGQCAPGALQCFLTGFTEHNQLCQH